MKFSEFLLLNESINLDKIKKHQVIIDDELAVELIKKHCDVDTILYRGINISKYDSDYLFIDGNKGKARKSAHTKNYYTLLLDNNFVKNGFPLRSNSTICTTSKNIAKDYASQNDDDGKVGKAFVILPYKNNKFGVTEKDDIWRSTVEIGDFEFEIHMWNDVFKALKLSDKSYDQFMNDLKELYNKSYDIAVENANIYYMERKNVGSYNATENEIIDFINDDYFHSTMNHNVMISNIKKLGVRFVSSLIIKLFGLDSNKVESIMNDAYSSDKMGMRMVEFDSVDDLRGDLEVWFSGKAVAIEMGVFDDMLKQGII